MMREIYSLRFFLPFFVSAVLLGGGCRHSTPSAGGGQDHPARKVMVSVVGRSPRTQHVEQAGTVAARHRADIETKVQARVERIGVAIGTRVQRGELLAELDTREIRARLTQAQALREQAAQDFARYETLLAGGAVTRQEYDGVKARQEVAEASWAEAEAMLSYAQITAPFSGTIIDRAVNVGDLAVPGRPLFTLEDGASLQFVAAVPEAYRGRVNLGESLRVSVPVAAVEYSAVVDELSPSADPGSRTFVVKLALPDPSGLRAGQYGHLLLPTGEEAVASIPLSALVRRGQLELVYVASDEHRAGLRFVRTGRRSTDQIEVLAGLRDGERVIVNPPAGLSDGDAIEEPS
ncbi:MAG: efflux RND transporter periplasmic adaptor subunit [Candidatus Zixiibacteriota bacterium]